MVRSDAAIELSNTGAADLKPRPSITDTTVDVAAAGVHAIGTVPVPADLLRPLVTDTTTDAVTADDTATPIRSKAKGLLGEQIIAAIKRGDESKHGSEAHYIPRCTEPDRPKYRDRSWPVRNLCPSVRDCQGLPRARAQNHWRIERLAVSLGSGGGVLGVLS
jgi:hypothetical protein